MVLLIAEVLATLGLIDQASQVVMLSPVTWLIWGWLYLMAFVMTGGNTG